MGNGLWNITICPKLTSRPAIRFCAALLSNVTSALVMRSSTVMSPSATPTLYSLPLKRLPANPVLKDWVTVTLPGASVPVRTPVMGGVTGLSYAIGSVGSNLRVCICTNDTVTGTHSLYQLLHQSCTKLARSCRSGNVHSVASDT